ncbi:MAG: hypothetical protein OXK80_07095 [Bdellovibrionales bacterium]|nr:hypothetical protein [Bdellovibrionales bacterium]
MMSSYFLVFIIILSHFVYSSECENHFLNVIVRSIHSIQADLLSHNPELQIKAIQEIRDIKPDSATINKWIVPFLKFDNPQIRFSAVQVIGDGADLYPQFIGTLLLHLRSEDFQPILLWINERVSHIPSRVRQAFYQGHWVAGDINRLNIHFAKMAQWLVARPYVLNSGGITDAFQSALYKREEDRSTVDKEVIEMVEEAKMLTATLSTSLLQIPHDTYSDFLRFLSTYILYSNNTVHIREEVHMLLKEFYRNADDSSK